MRPGLALATLLLLAGAPGHAQEPERAPEPLRFEALDGWAEADHAPAFEAFRRSCRAILVGQPGSAGARPPSAGLVSACIASLALTAPDPTNARAFFEAWFDPVRVSDDGRGFLTGYFEPEVAGSLRPGPDAPVPLLGPPAGLVPRPEDGVPEGWPAGLTAARRTASGFEALPDRAAIEAGALGDAAPPVAFLADPVDAFMVHVQGSARLRLPDGGIARVGFAGRNGHPYTPVGRELARLLGVPPATMTADRVYAWLRAHPAEAKALTDRNRSFIFFRRLDAANPDDGPVGAAGIPLVPGLSLAVDRTAWSYGTPIWLEGSLPVPGGGSAPLRRLTVAHDTGAAIVGPERGDLFFGSGPDAGAAASLVRESVRWVALRPKGEAGSRPAGAR